MIPAPLAASHENEQLEAQYLTPAAGTDLHPRLQARVRSLFGAGPGLPAPLRVQVAQAADGVPQLHVDESYQLRIAGHEISLQAQTTWGALHGLTTLYQLQQQDQLQDGLTINDQPRFPWRGLLLDVARHFISIPLLQRVVEGMAMLKLNVLHLHLTDDQGFRFVSRAYPKLASAQAYTREALRGLVEFAAQRGIRVVPELDVPGHVTSWLTAYPEFGFGQVAASRRFGVHEACLDPANEAVYTFLQTLFAEVAEVFPDRYLHIGGDEVHPAWWRKDAQIQRFMQQQGMADTADLQNYFNTRVCAILTALGRRAVGWDEVLHPQMPDMVVQNWRGATTRDRILTRPLPCLISAGYYLDLFYPNEFHYRYDPQAAQAELLALEDSWQQDVRMAHVAAGVEWTKQWRRDALTEDADQDGVLGGEACLWAELVDEQTLEVRLWSRLPSVAERLWSAAQVTDTEDFYRRLQAVLQLPQLALTARQAEEWSALGLSPGQQALVSLLEPVKWYARLLGEEALQARLRGTEMPQARPYSVDSELNRIVDFISPESFAARAFVRLPEHEIVQHAHGWLALQPDDWPADVQPAVRGMAELGQALLARQQGRLTIEAYHSLLNKLLQPHGEYMLAVVPFLLQRPV